MSSSRPDEEQAANHVVDLLMPIDVFWDIGKMLERADFMQTNDDEMVDIHEIYRKVFRIAAPYALIENDRIWLSQRAAGKKKEAPSPGPAPGDGPAGGN